MSIFSLVSLSRARSSPITRTGFACYGETTWGRGDCAGTARVGGPFTKPQSSSGTRSDRATSWWRWIGRGSTRASSTPRCAMKTSHVCSSSASRVYVGPRRSASGISPSSSQVRHSRRTSEPFKLAQRCRTSVEVKSRTFLSFPHAAATGAGTDCVCPWDAR